MSSASHLSKQVQQLIKSIGETKSKQEQDKIIQGELSNLKHRLNEKGQTSRKIKQSFIIAIYIQMLGHSASFCHIQAINLTQNKNLVLKRMGYLLCSLFLNSNSELTIMLISTIQKDLASSNIHEIAICLTSIVRIINSTIASAITDAVIKLLSHNNDLIRKKAILILQRIKQVQGGQFPQFDQKMKKALCDQQPCVMAASLNLYLQQIKQNPKKYRQLTSSFILILKQIIQHKLPKQFDYHRLPAPWVQMNLIKIAQILSKGDLKSSQHCYVILQQALKRSQDGNNNISFAVCFQCVKAICNIYPNHSLIEQAVSSLSKFLESYSSNAKYMGIKGLGYVYKQNPKLVENYQLVIVDCLESKDQALKKQTLQLLYRMTNNSNVQVIVSKMLNSLHSSTDSHFRNALVLKITSLIQRFGPSHEWYIQTMCLLFQLGSQYLTEQVLNNFLKLVIEKCQEDQNFGSEIMGKMVELLGKVVPTDFIIKAAVWILGEVGSGMVKQAGEVQRIFNTVVNFFEYDLEEECTKIWIIDALVKLSSTKGFSLHDQVKNILNNYSKSFDIEICQRSLQSKKLAKYNAALRLNNKIVFEDGLNFLKNFVDNSRKNGAKEYQKISYTTPVGNQLKFTPYQGKKVQTAFPFKLDQKQKQKKKQQDSPSSKLPFKSQPQPQKSTPPSKSKPIAPTITAEDRNKQKLISTLFSGGNKTKMQTTKAAPNTIVKKQSQTKVDDSLI